MKKQLFCAGVLLLSTLGLGAQDYITYEQFGAAGDGIHDDQTAIVAAHEEANRQGLPVKAADGKKYYIGKGKDVALIKTDVDFGTAEFIINDIETEDHTSPVFCVESNLDPIELKLGPIHKGQKSLGIKLPCKCLVEIVNSNHKVYIRKGVNQNNGTAQREMLLVKKNGRITPKSLPVWDYDEVTKATAYPVDDKPLTIKGGVFTTIANQAESKYVYRRRGIRISRSLSAPTPDFSPATKLGGTSERKSFSTVQARFQHGSREANTLIFNSLKIAVFRGTERPKQCASAFLCHVLV